MNVGLFLLSFLFSFSAAAQTVSDCGIKNHTTQHGEVLKYKIYYTLAGFYVGAGEVIFRNRLEQYQNKTVFHISSYGRTYSSYDWIYKVRDLYETYIDTATFLPLKFTRDIHEAGDHFYHMALFQYPQRRVQTTNGNYSFPACTQDVLSAIYYARNLDYSRCKPGDKFPFPLFLDEQVYPVYIRYLGREKLSTRFGEYQTIKFKPLLIDGTIFKGGEDMTVWVSDDENHIPVMVETPILVGKIRVYLESYQQLRFPPKGILRGGVQ
ncbi:MAG TPA: DUF3108 domain-containing protein [Chitinophagaceae bacterium]|nr:DUF3108 domain-containing protein [Chitinophagaceae bacterium]HNF70839.1 DUF3108 domain-containing protein [Chitinophagaceae bacterium]